ncbi:hypothetical protein [Aporhodopirellula aestuarii]|uniref:Uncharacterized protein n=1 Tax=Aporhodopirellula aestuarii TaxID=2950107 RepID=A0ABT0U1X3_9BACT|nr:hypothetical protein [Aporhodopirellula aestuarii]MCM2370891.1 hypothetical protein [Aporhodopirellula aestuarii]
MDFTGVFLKENLVTAEMATAGKRTDIPGDGIPPNHQETRLNGTTARSIFNRHFLRKTTNRQKCRGLPILTQSSEPEQSAGCGKMT